MFTSRYHPPGRSLPRHPRQYREVRYHCRWIGLVGAALANRLSENPTRSVLLLEADPDYPDLDHLPDEVKYGYATWTDVMTSDHNWQFMGKATDSAEPMMVPSGKVTSGSSAISGQMLLRVGGGGLRHLSRAGERRVGVREAAALLPQARDRHRLSRRLVDARVHHWAAHLVYVQGWPGVGADAVVDQYGRVHGLEGIRVVDPSIMPDCVRANTTVTAIMIGERVADFMRNGK